ncbi:hypothetical protein GDO86_005342 [Hymenochirus boettgeri]|uniref:P-type ATPase N-terminal domain-containing protein n=1 Tax=Hymenochirus boettgeri TaxID=247094 RepID=A0A8T2J6K1_9PIPI|nr:hypothetical protein GDO86_005342 [Hymenochirus boettgeri]
MSSVFHDIWEELFRWKTKKDESNREVRSNLLFEGPNWNENPNNQYQTNNIKTTKYTFLTFLPKNLFEQFHRFANVYFVAIAALNFVPVVNAFQPAIAVIPVLVILAITAIKDIWEDFRRFKSDKEINSMGCLVFSSFVVITMDTRTAAASNVPNT